MSFGQRAPPGSGHKGKLGTRTHVLSEFRRWLPDCDLCGSAISLSSGSRMTAGVILNIWIRIHVVPLLELRPEMP